MKKLFFACLLAATVFACKKTENVPVTDPSYVAVVEKALQDSLPAVDYASLDLTHAIQMHIDSANIHLLRVPIMGKDIAKDFIVVKTDAAGHIQQGKFISITKDNDASSFNGSIAYRSLKGNPASTFAIRKGRIKQPQAFRTNLLVKEADPEMNGGDLPEVIVYSFVAVDGGINWSDWYNLLAMLNAGNDGGGAGGGNWYYPGGGGGGGGTAPAVQIDFENWDSKAAIDIKKYMDCFGTVPSTNATYTISISSDIPVDGDPSAFFDWSEQSPGHAFITMTKSSGSNSVTQNFGFYPSSGVKAATGNNTDGKMVDNAGHEFNAQYTINITASQFQSALASVNTYSSFQYIISSFNCTDYALNIFNAAGGNLSIPKYQIPNYGTPNGSNTPQGLYNAINSLKTGGNTNASAGSAKQYAGGSHGPC